MTDEDLILVLSAFCVQCSVAYGGSWPIGNPETLANQLHHNPDFRQKMLANLRISMDRFEQGREEYQELKDKGLTDSQIHEILDAMEGSKGPVQ